MEVKPQPAPRKNQERAKTDLKGFENEAFLPDNEEEVLTIETDYSQEDTKIQLSLSTVNKLKMQNQIEETATIEEMSEQDFEDNYRDRTSVLERPKSEMEKRNNFMIDNDKSRKKQRSKSVSEIEKRSNENRDSDQDTTVSSFSEEGENIKRKKSRSKSVKKHRRKHSKSGNLSNN